MKYKLSKQAKADIFEIYAYGHQRWGTSAVDRYYRGLFEAIASIEFYPSASREVGNGLRLKVYRSHLILYRIDRTKLSVLRVVHGHYDWQSELLPEIKETEL
jgi:toxin ParE1/3/4